MDELDPDIADVGDVEDIVEFQADIITIFGLLCNVSIVTTGGISLMRRLAFLFPKEAINCS
jgi:hypothetical protein